MARPAFLFSLLHTLTPDGRLLFATRCARLFGYGLYSVVLVFFLTSVGLTKEEIGFLLTLTLLGDTAISLWLTTTADRVGRRRMLLVGSLLMIGAGVVFASASNFWLLLLAATIGVISPTGNEVGPFLSIEQAALSQTVPEERRTHIFAWYNLVGSVATAAGALCGGAITQLMKAAGAGGADTYRPLAVVYTLLGLSLALAFARLSPAAEHGPVPNQPQNTPPEAAGGGKNAWSGRWGLGSSLPVVLKLAGLFALDAFGGGFVIQSIMAYWFYVRFHVEPAAIGAIFFGANLLAAMSSLAAAAVARRIGLVNTMVLTHLPSNVLLILIPLMPTRWLAILLLWLRFSISQMDVPTRQSYTMAVVRPEERSAAAGVTGVARSLGAAVSPMLAVLLVEQPALLSVPFFLAGGLKIVYDLLLYWSFVALKPAEEKDANRTP
jgi:MFS family permease